MVKDYNGENINVGDRFTLTGADQGIMGTVLGFVNQSEVRVSWDVPFPDDTEFGCWLMVVR